MARDEGGPALAGEKIETVRWEDCRHWIGIYSDLMKFKRSVLARVNTELEKLQDEARVAAQTDVEIISVQMAGYQQRLNKWYSRLWELQGLWIDPEGNVIRYQGRAASLTERERQLLQFLMDRPQRYASASQIAGQAWGEASLSSDQVRNYVSKIRRVLRDLQIPCQVVNRAGRGYTLVLDDA